MWLLTLSSRIGTWKCWFMHHPSILVWLHRLLKTGHYLHPTQFILSVEFCLFLLIFKKCFFPSLICLKPSLDSFILCFWRFSKVVDNWLMASFCEVILRFLGRTETLDFCTSFLSFLDALFKTTSSSSMEVPSWSASVGWHSTLIKKLKNTFFRFRKTEILTVFWVRFQYSEAN